MANERQAIVSIMPSFSGRKVHDYYHTATMKTDLEPADLGKAVSDCIEKIERDGHDLVLDQVSLEIRFG